MAKTYDASVFNPPHPPLFFPPNGLKSIPATAMSSSLTPTNARGGGGGSNLTHFFPSHTEKNKQMPDKQRKM